MGNRIDRLILKLFDRLFGNDAVKNVLQGIFGYGYFRLFIHLTRYRACHMVSRGETCLLAGIFYESTIKDYSTAVGPRGKVIVIEANPANIARLKKSVDAPNVCYINNAVWNKNGRMEFIASVGDEQGYNRLDTPEMQEFPYHMDEKPEKIEVETNTLDAIVDKLEIEKVHHVNLTINGAELQALDGISGLMRKNSRLRIYINSEYPVPSTAVIEKLKSMGFRVYTSRLITTINKKIRLIRIYAVYSG
jgi:FkbM family methyltransferase